MLNLLLGNFLRPDLVQYAHVKWCSKIAGAIFFKEECKFLCSSRCV
jgi:hypothetical protein